MKIFIWLLSLVVSAYASAYQHLIFSDSFTKSCAYVHKADSWHESIFSSLSPRLELTPMDDETAHSRMFFGPNHTMLANEETQVNALIMNADDFLKVDFGGEFRFDRCDEVAYDKKLCYNSEKSGSNVSLAELIESKDFTSPFEKFTYNTSTRFEYNFEKSGVYCIVLYPDSMTPAKEGEYFTPLSSVFINWQSSFGELQYIDFQRLLLSFYLTLSYGIYFLIYANIVTRRVSYHNSNLVKTYQNMRFMFQYKILSFLAGAFLIQLITVINYAFMNKYEYYNVPTPIVVIFGTLEMLTSTVFTFWIIYNLMLFSAGAWVGSLKKSSKKVLITRVICATLFFETVLHHIQRGSVSELFNSWGREYAYEIVSVKFIIIGALCFVWSFYTTYKIDDKQTKKLYIKSMLLLGLMFSSAITLNFVSQSYKVEYLTNHIEFLTMAAFSLLWKDITFQNGVLCLE